MRADPYIERVLIEHGIKEYVQIENPRPGTVEFEFSPVPDKKLLAILVTLVEPKILTWRELKVPGIIPTGEDKLASSGNMTKAEYMAFHQAACEKMMAITKAKNSDYTGDSGDPFANFAQIGMLVQAPNVVEIGFLTRMSDKLSRVGSFVTKGSLQVKDESVKDTLFDLANYCILFAGYLESKKSERIPT